MSVRALLLPGVVLPADLAYGDLVRELGADVEAVPKELEVYRTSTPPPDYSLDVEVEGLLETAERLRWDRFNLVGYSGGGSAGLAFAARHPSMLTSLALLEPAWAGSWDWSAGHRALWERYAALEQQELPPEQLLGEFMRLQVRPGVRLPPPPAGASPPWMSQRPEGIRAFTGTFRSYDLDRAALAAFEAPVYFGLGGLSNPDQFAEEAERLRGVFADFTLEVFEDRHHFDPPHRVEPARLAASLRALWQRAEQPRA